MAYEDSKNVSLGASDVAIALTHGLFGSHLGMAYPGEDGAPKLLHLANHNLLKVEPYAQDNWIASKVQFDSLEAIQLIALVRNYAKLHPSKGGPNYGINLLAGRGAIDAQGNYSPSEPSAGYTCASIVAEIFNASGFGPVDLDRWKASDENRIWGRAVVCMLEAGKAAPEHVAAVAKSIDGLRLLPEEVAAAAELDSGEWPAQQAALTKRARELTEEIRRKCGPPIQIPHDSPYAACIGIYQETGRQGATVMPPPIPIQSLMRLITESIGRSAAPPLRLVAPLSGHAGVSKVGRNEPCPCASGRKYKNCHGANV